MDKFLSEDHSRDARANANYFRAVEAQNRQQEGNVRSVTPLEDIDGRIRSAGYAIHDLAAQLEEHALAVHGPIPENDADCGTDAVIAQPNAALPRIYDALGGLDRAISRIAHATGRNTTLA
jgi:hypothetical protein